MCVWVDPLEAGTRDEVTRRKMRAELASDSMHVIANRVCTR